MTTKPPSGETGSLDDLIDQLVTHAVWKSAEERTLEGLKQLQRYQPGYGPNKAIFKALRLLKKRNAAVAEILEQIAKFEGKADDDTNSG